MIKSIIKPENVYQQIVINFSQKHYIIIMERVTELCDTTVLSKSEVLLELGFAVLDISRYDDGTGSGAPVLRIPLIFMIKKSLGFFDRTRPNKPDWFTRMMTTEKHMPHL